MLSIDNRLSTYNTKMISQQINGLETTDLFMVISSSNSGVANGVSKRNQQCGNGNWGTDADTISDG